MGSVRMGSAVEGSRLQGEGAVEQGVRSKEQGAWSLGKGMEQSSSSVAIICSGSDLAKMQVFCRYTFFSKMRLKGLLLKKTLFWWQIGLVQTSSTIPWLPLQALPLTCYRHKDDYNIGLPGSRILPHSDLKTCQVVTFKVPPKDLETCRLVC